MVLIKYTRYLKGDYVVCIKMLFSPLKAHIHPLTAAAAGGCEELVILLLNNGAFIDLQDRVCVY